VTLLLQLSAAVQSSSWSSSTAASREDTADALGIVAALEDGGCGAVDCMLFGSFILLPMTSSQEMSVVMSKLSPTPAAATLGAELTGLLDLSAGELASDPADCSSSIPSITILTPEQLTGLVSAPTAQLDVPQESRCIWTSVGRVLTAVPEVGAEISAARLSRTAAPGLEEVLDSTAAT